MDAIEKALIFLVIACGCLILTVAVYTATYITIDWREHQQYMQSQVCEV